MLVIDSLMTHARRGRFIGISNGVDFSSLNPFDDALLRRHNATFSRALVESHPGIAPIGAAKSAARLSLIQMGVFPASLSATTKIILFIGRFQINKGIALCEPLLRHIFSRGDALLVLMGQPHDFPMSDLLRMRDAGAVLLTTPEEQDRVGPLVRMSADVIFVPSQTEAFGLVAAEGLLFGALVVSTGVGGLREFLIDRPSSVLIGAQRAKERLDSAFNAMLFDRMEEGSMESAVTEALEVIDEAKRAGKADALRSRLVRSALDLAWNRYEDSFCLFLQLTLIRPGGPLSMYSAVYSLAAKLASSS